MELASNCVPVGWKIYGLLVTRIVFARTVIELTAMATAATNG